MATYDVLDMIRGPPEAPITWKSIETYTEYVREISIVAVAKNCQNDARVPQTLIMANKVSTFSKIKLN